MSLSIKWSKFLETEIPKIRVLIGIKSCMISTESISSIISKPNIIAVSNKLESRSNVRVMNNPSCGTAKKTMLEKYNRGSWLSILVACYPIYSQNISIRCSYEMLFIYKSCFFNYFLKCLIIFGWFLSWPVSRGTPVNSTIFMFSYWSELFVLFFAPIK